MVTFAQSQIETVVIPRHADIPLNQWYEYGDGEGLYFVGDQADEKLDLMITKHSPEDRPERVTYLDPYTGEFHKVDLYRTDDPLVVFFKVDDKVVITLNRW